MENVLPWVCFSLVFGSAVAGRRLITEYGSPVGVLQADPAELYRRGVITEYQRGRFERAEWLDAQARRIVSTCRRFGWQILTPENGQYPAVFKKLSDMPPVLYADGDLQVLGGRRYAAVVGTRSADAVTQISAYNLGKALSEAGVVTVSGGALGIDRAAHEGALAGGGQTVCVLGTGLGAEYLPENDFLRRRISRSGVLLTEMPPAQQASKYSFPRRNRLIAALGETLTVLQSGVIGGSMISAGFAAEYKRPLFVLSDRVYASPGCSQLAQTKNAAVLEDTAALTSFYGAGAQGAPLYSPHATLPKILDPARCTPEEYASLNGVREAEAYPLYLSLLEKAAAAPAQSQPKPHAQAPKKPPAKPPAQKQTRRTRQAPPVQQAPPEPPPALSGDRKTVYGALSRTPVDMDSLGEQTGLSPAKLMSAVTMLELDGYVVLHPGNRISLK